MIHDVRDRALFSLIYLYGLRVGEVALLQHQDLDRVAGRIVIKRLKGGYWTERPLFAQAQVVLEQYLSTEAADPSAPLFPGRSGPLRKRQVQSLFVRYRVAARLPIHLTTHSLRHAIATHLLDAGASLEFVQDHLGHRSLSSTSIYARISDRHRGEVFRQLAHSPWIVHPTNTVAPADSADAA